MTDGEIIISTKLDSGSVEKDLNRIENSMKNAGKQIETSMNNAEKSMKNASKAFNGNQVAKELENVGKSIKNTTDKIDLQKKKLSDLKTAYEKATNPTSKNKIEEQMIKAEASVIKLETKLNGLKDKQVSLKMKIDAGNGLDGSFTSAEMSATKHLDNIEKKAIETGALIKKSLSNIEIGEGISAVGGKISSVGDKLTMGVTLPLVGIGVAAAKVGMDFDSSMSRVKAISGATGEEFKQLHDQALQLGADTAFSAKEAAQGMEALSAAGFTTKETMTAMPGLLDLAASSGESLATSSDIAASTLRGFGLEAGQAGHVADVLAKNANATNAAVADTGEAMKYVAPVAHSMGLSLEEVTAAIGEMANSGIQGSMAGTTLRSALTRLASPSKEASDEMKSIGFNAFDSKGKLKSFSDIMGEYNKALSNKTDKQKEDLTATIFGQEAMSGMLVMMQGGKQGLDDLTNSYKSADGAASEMAKTMQDNSKSAVEQMTGSLETTAIKLEEDFAPIIIEVCNKIQDLANAFSELSPEQQEFYAKTLLAVAAAAPALKLIGGLTSGVGGLVTGVSKLAKFLAPAAAAETALGVEAAASTGGLAAFGGALAAIAPVALPIIAALAAVSVGVAAVATANDQMGDKLTTTTDDMTEWQKAINGMTGYTFKSKKELSDLGIEYKQFGDNISDNFKKKVEESTDTLHKFELFLQTINLDGIITDSESSDFNNQINKMVNDAISTINSKKSETNKSLSDLFKLDDNYINENEQKILDYISKGYDEQVKQENQLKTEILAIKQKAVDEKRALNEQEIKDVQSKSEKIKEIELNAVGGTAEEKAYGKNEFGARVETIGATDASKLLQDKKKALDEENVQIKASYDTKIDMLKTELATADGENATAIQTEIDKFTKLRDEKTKLKNDEWSEYIKILKEKNPKALALINEFTGEELKKEDKDAQDRLSKMEETYQGLNEITESGTYKIWNTASNSAEDVTVTVDEATKKIVGAYSSTTGDVAGYTDQMAKTNAELGRSHTKLASECQLALNDLGSAHINASGEIKNSSGKIVGNLKDIVTENGHVVSGIYDLNGTPIKIETNADGTIKNMQDVIDKIQQIPKQKYVTVTLSVNNESSIQSLVDEKLLTRKMQGNYTGTNVIKTGLSHVNEHGYETANNNNVQMLNNGLAFLIGSHYSGGDGINTHMTTVNEMHNDITDQVGNTIAPVINALISALGGQSTLLNQVVQNTAKTVATGEKSNLLNEKLATDLVSKYNSTSGTFSTLQTEITTANDAKTKADKMKIEDNKWYSDSKKKLDDVNSQMDELQNKINSSNDDVIGVDDKNVKKISETEKKQLEAQKHVLDNKKDSLEKEVDYYKDAAQKEIDTCKDNAEQQVKIANDKKDRLTKVAEAVTAAIKNELTLQKEAADTTLNNELTQLETEYKNATKKLDDELKAKTDEIDAQIKALEDETTDTSRQDERTTAKNNINVLTTKMNNTASEADKQSILLQIQEAQKELSNKENSWSIEDKKAELEAEKTALSEREEVQKASLEEQYNTSKEAKEKELKDTNSYYDKLLETDSVNAQARYTMLNSSQEELVALLNAYAPNWQNAGQSLADSLLTGLNSQKQSVQDAVNEMISLKGQQAATQTKYNYYDEKGNLLKGYASGTDYNSNSGYYDTNENGFELNTSGDVAYISEGAGIKNHMQSLKYIDDTIYKQVAMMKASIIQSNLDVAKSLGSMIAKTTNTNNNTSKVYSPTLHIENYVQNTSQDVEQLANEFGVISYRQRVD